MKPKHTVTANMRKHYQHRTAVGLRISLSNVRPLYAAAIFAQQTPQVLRMYKDIKHATFARAYGASPSTIRGLNKGRPDLIIVDEIEEQK